MIEELNDRKVFEFDVEKSKQWMKNGYIWAMCLIPFSMVFLYFLIHEDALESSGLLETFGLLESSGLLELILILICITIVMEVIFFYFMKYNPFAPKKMTLEFLEDRFLINRDKTK